MPAYIPTTTVAEFVSAVDRALVRGVPDPRLLGVAHAIQETWDECTDEQAAIVVAGLDALLERGPASLRGVALAALQNRSGVAIWELLARWVERAPEWLDEENPERPGEPLGATLVCCTLPDLDRQEAGLAPAVERLAIEHGARADWVIHWVSREPIGRGFAELARWRGDAEFPGKWATSLGAVYGGVGRERLETVAGWIGVCDDADVEAFYSRATRRMRVGQRRQLMAWLRPGREVLSEPAQTLDRRVEARLADPHPANLAALGQLLSAQNRALGWYPWGGLARLEPQIPGLRWVWGRVADASAGWLEGSDVNLQRLALGFTLMAPAPSLRRAIRSMVYLGRHRAEGLAALISMNDRSAAELCKKTLRSEDRQIRAISWLGFTRLGTEGDLQRALSQLATPDDAQVRDMICLGLGARTEPHARAALLDQMHLVDLRPATWLAVRQALWEQADTVQETLLEQARGADVALAARALEALALNPLPAARAALLRALEADPDGPTGLAAAEALIHRRETQGVEHLVRRLEHPDVAVRAQAATRLASTGHQEGLAAFLPLLFEPERSGLVQLGLVAIRADHLAGVRRLVNDPHPRVREAARLVLGARVDSGARENSEL